MIMSIIYYHFTNLRDCGYFHDNVLLSISSKLNSETNVLDVIFHLCDVQYISKIDYFINYCILTSL